MNKESRTLIIWWGGKNPPQAAQGNVGNMCEVSRRAGLVCIRGSRTGRRVEVPPWDSKSSTPERLFPVSGEGLTESRMASWRRKALPWA